MEGIFAQVVSSRTSIVFCPSTLDLVLEGFCKFFCIKTPVNRLLTGVLMQRI